MFVWKWVQKFNPIEYIYFISSFLISIAMPLVIIGKDMHIEMINFLRISQNRTDYHFYLVLFIFAAIASWWLFFVSSTNDCELGKNLIHVRSKCYLKEPPLWQKE